MTEKEEEKYWSEHSVCSMCGNIYVNTETDMICPDCQMDSFNVLIDNDLKDILIEKFKNFKGDFVSKRLNYEKDIADIIGFKEDKNKLYDIINNDVKVELKKQQNAQWLDVYKIANLSEDELYNISVLFLYYKKGEKNINTMAILTYKEILDILDISDNDLFHISKVKNLKIQMKYSLSKTKVLNKSSFILT